MDLLVTVPTAHLKLLKFLQQTLPFYSYKSIDVVRPAVLARCMELQQLHIFPIVATLAAKREFVGFHKLLILYAELFLCRFDLSLAAFLQRWVTENFPARI